MAGGLDFDRPVSSLSGMPSSMTNHQSPNPICLDLSEQGLVIHLELFGCPAFVPFFFL